MTTTTTLTCPACGKQHTDSIGHTDGPREFHAECWDSLTGWIFTNCDDYPFPIRNATTEECQAGLLGDGTGLFLHGELIDECHPNASQAVRLRIVVNLAK